MKKFTFIAMAWLGFAAVVNAQTDETSNDKNWLYSASAYQDFDPGTFKIQSTPYQDRTQIYKAAVTKRYNDGRGAFTAAYHYSNSHPIYWYASQWAPFIYVGDGSVKEYGKFKLGTTSYLPVDNTMTYRDIKTGELKEANLYDASLNRSSEFTLMNNYRWDNGTEWKIIGRYDHSRGALVYQSAMSLIDVKNNSDYAYMQIAADGTVIAPTSLDYNWFNYCLSLAATYKMNDKFGFTGDFTYIVQHPRFESFGTSTLPNTDRVSVPLGRVGIYYNNSWLSLTSLFSYISKTNNNSTLILQHDNEIMQTPLNYNIQTIGWTTDVMAHPTKALDIHFLLTLQKPTYRKYETSVKFSDGYVGSIDATGNIVTDIPQILIEFDPSYKITRDLRVWTSFRYFGKTYANINEAYYFNGHWETFGGVDWQINKKLSVACSVTNFLNQTGAKGTIAGAELITKDDVKNIKNKLMTGSYLRPFTVEFSARLNF